MGQASGPGLLAQGEDPSPHHAHLPELPLTGHHHSVPKHLGGTVLFQSRQRGNGEKWLTQGPWRIHGDWKSHPVLEPSATHSDHCLRPVPQALAPTWPYLTVLPRVADKAATGPGPVITRNQPTRAASAPQMGEAQAQTPS